MSHVHSRLHNLSLMIVFSITATSKMKCTFVFLSILHVCYSAKILGVFPTPSYSHQITFQPIWKELSLRGHQVTVVTPNPLKDPSLVNLLEVDIGEVSYEIWKFYNISTYGVKEEVTALDWNVFVKVMVEQVGAIMKIPQVYDLFVRGKKGDFDLVIVEPVEGVQIIKDVYQCPLVAIFSHPLMNMMHTSVGNPTHPVLYPDFFIHFDKDMGFLERLKSTIVDLVLPLVFRRDLRRVEDKLREYLPNMRDPLYAFREASIVFANTNPVLEVRRPLVPKAIEFSGIHIRAPKALPVEIAAFMDKATEGVIYISFGSNIKSSDMPIHKLKSILNAIAELPFKVLWKFEADNLPSQPPNLLVQKWLPQQDVLRHPNLKLFVTQGGLQSLDEAMFTGTPVVVVPFFGDQQANAQKVENVGMGKYLRYATLTKDGFKDAILEVSTEKFAKRAVELQNIVTDKPQQPLEMVIWWIEYVIRHKGAKHLRSPALDIPTYQFYLLDVIGFVLGVIFIVLFIAVKSIKFLLRLCFGGNKRKKE